MPDREKVVRGLEHCVGEEHANCENCPYLMDVVGVGCYTRLKRDALALLKEQEAVEPIGGYGFYICGVCKNPLNSASQKFCSECGKAVKWDD